MKETIKKTFLLGLGAASLTKAELQKRAKVLVKKAGINAKDGKEVLKKVLAEAAKTQNKVNKMLMTESKKVKTKVSKKYDPKIKQLKNKITVLEKKLQKEGKRVAKGAVKKVYKKL